jgi:hypothetical protein
MLAKYGFQNVEPGSKGSSFPGLEGKDDYYVGISF